MYDHTLQGLGVVVMVIGVLMLAALLIQGVMDAQQKAPTPETWTINYDKTQVGTGWRGIPACEKTIFDIGQPPSLTIGAYRDTESNWMRMECVDPPSDQDIKFRRSLHLWGEKLMIDFSKYSHAEFLCVVITAGSSPTEYHPYDFSFVQGEYSYYTSRDDFVGTEGFEKGQELWPGESIDGYLGIPNEVNTSRQFELVYQGARGVFCGF